MINLYVFQLRNDNNIELLDEDIKTHCLKYRNQEQLQRSLSCWSKLKEILNKNFEIENIHLKFKKDKPYLKDSNLFFSISHSKELGAILVSNEECGVDIERCIPKEKAHIAKRVLSVEEYKIYLDNFSSLDYLNAIWVKKEAYGKYLGCGLSKEILTNNVDNPNLKVFHYNSSTYYVSWYTKDAFKLTICESI